jgi:predicted restriction endonuclease
MKKKLIEAAKESPMLDKLSRDELYEMIAELQISYEEMRDKLLTLKWKFLTLKRSMEEIDAVASISEGTEFYAMLAKKALDNEYVGDTEPRSEF